MAYWIHENGQTIGPLRAIEVLERAQPETLVSNEQGWVPFAAHPDFRREPIVGGISGPTIRTASNNTGIASSKGSSTDELSAENPHCGYDTQYWILTPGSKNYKGPYSHERVERQGADDLLVSHGSQWVRKSHHPDFVKQPARQNTRSRVFAACSKIFDRASPISIPPRKVMIGAVLILSLIASVLLSLPSATIQVRKAHDLFKEGESEKAREIYVWSVEKAEKYWETGRHAQATEIYQELLKNDAFSLSDVHFFENRIMVFLAETSRWVEWEEYARRWIIKGEIWTHDDPAIFQKFVDLSTTVRLAQLEIARTPIQMRIVCQSTNRYNMQDEIGYNIWRIAHDNPDRLKLEATIYFKNITDRYGNPAEISRSLVIEDLNKVRRYQSAELFSGDDYNPVMADIWGILPVANHRGVLKY